MRLPYEDRQVSHLGEPYLFDGGVKAHCTYERITSTPRCPVRILYKFTIYSSTPKTVDLEQGQRRGGAAVAAWPPVARPNMNYRCAAIPFYVFPKNDKTTVAWHPNRSRLHGHKLNQIEWPQKTSVLVRPLFLLHLAG